MHTGWVVMSWILNRLQFFFPRLSRTIQWSKQQSIFATFWQWFTFKWEFKQHSKCVSAYNIASQSYENDPIQNSGKFLKWQVVNTPLKKRTIHPDLAAQYSGIIMSSLVWDELNLSWLL